MRQFLTQVLTSPVVWADLAMVGGLIVAVLWPGNWSVGVLAGGITLRLTLDVASAVCDGMVLKD